MAIRKINAKVESICQHCHDTKSFILRPQEQLQFTAGQFIMVNLPHGNTIVRRAYSIASMPGGETIELCINQTPNGTASSFFFSLKGGESIVIDGPYGIFKTQATPKTKFFIATGTGIAPIRSMIHGLLAQGSKAKLYLIFGERIEDELLYKKEFEQLQATNKNFYYIPTISRPHNRWVGEKGYVQHAMKKYINEPHEIEAYVCGLKEMVEDVKKTLLELGVEPQHIFTEKFV